MYDPYKRKIKNDVYFQDTHAVHTLLQEIYELQVNNIDSSMQIYHFQVDNRPATPTTPHKKWVKSYKMYPVNKSPTLNSATYHNIQPMGHGTVPFQDENGIQEDFNSKVIP